MRILESQTAGGSGAQGFQHCQVYVRPRLGPGNVIARAYRGKPLSHAQSGQAVVYPDTIRIAGHAEPVTEPAALRDQCRHAREDGQAGRVSVHPPPPECIQRGPVQRPAHEFFQMRAGIEAVNVTDRSQPIGHLQARPLPFVQLLPGHELGHLGIDHQTVKIEDERAGRRRGRGHGAAVSWALRRGASRLAFCLLLTLPAATLLAQTLAVPTNGAYTGAYMDFGETEDTVTPKALEDFEQLVGKHQAIVASSSYWGVGTFPLAGVQTISAYGAVPLLYWSPWGPPYEQGKEVHPGKYGLRHIADGDWDKYIDGWAEGARVYGRPLLVSFACEMNSNWFPWSGRENGADAPGEAAGAYAGPEAYKRAYRHVVDRVRAAGARNISWVFQPNNTSHPGHPWNALAQYYPGGDYVDWLSMSAYGQLTPEDDWTEWKEAVSKPYRALCALDPVKPVMLAEWGVGEFPQSGSKAEFVRAAFQAMNGGQYPRLKAAVFWHERWQNSDESYSNLRVQSSAGSLKAYREGVANPFWLDRPTFSK